MQLPYIISYPNPDNNFYYQYSYPYNPSYITGQWQWIPEEKKEEEDVVKIGQYRVGNHNPRNIYRVGLNRDTEEHVAVAFSPEIAKLIVDALNKLLEGNQ